MVSLAFIGVNDICIFNKCIHFDIIQVSQTSCTQASLNCCIHYLQTWLTLQFQQRINEQVKFDASFLKFCTPISKISVLDNWVLSWYLSLIPQIKERDFTRTVFIFVTTHWKDRPIETWRRWQAPGCLHTFGPWETSPWNDHIYSQHGALALRPKMVPSPWSSPTNTLWSIIFGFRPKLTRLKAHSPSTTAFYLFQASLPVKLKICLKNTAGCLSPSLHQTDQPSLDFQQNISLQLACSCYPKWLQLEKVGQVSEHELLSNLRSRCHYFY